MPVRVSVPVQTRTHVRACAHARASARACVWVEVGLCVPMTIRSVTNAIVSILTRGKPDLHVFLRSWCKLVLSGLSNLNWTSM